MLYTLYVFFYDVILHTKQSSNSYLGVEIGVKLDKMSQLELMMLRDASLAFTRLVEEHIQAHENKN